MTITMEPSAKVYYANRKLSMIYLFLSFAPLIALLYFHREIMHVLHLPPGYILIYGWMVGVIHTLVSYGRLRAFSKPKIRICDHFFISSYDQNAIEWDQITRMRVTTEGWLVTTVSSAGKSYRNSVNMRSISNRKKFLDDVRRICEIKGIPLERPEDL